jgi:hypothetical protein
MLVNLKGWSVSAIIAVAIPANPASSSFTVHETACGDLHERAQTALVGEHPVKMEAKTSRTNSWPRRATHHRACEMPTVPGQGRSHDG